MEAYLQGYAAVILNYLICYDSEKLWIAPLKTFPGILFSEQMREINHNDGDKIREDGLVFPPHQHKPLPLPCYIHVKFKPPPPWSCVHELLTPAFLSGWSDTVTALCSQCAGGDSDVPVCTWPLPDLMWQFIKVTHIWTATMALRL